VGGGVEQMLRMVDGCSCGPPRCVTYSLATWDQIHSHPTLLLPTPAAARSWRSAGVPTRLRTVGSSRCELDSCHSAIAAAASFAPVADAAKHPPTLNFLTRPSPPILLSPCFTPPTPRSSPSTATLARQSAPPLCWSSWTSRWSSTCVSVV